MLPAVALSAREPPDPPAAGVSGAAELGVSGSGEAGCVTVELGVFVPAAPAVADDVGTALCASFSPPEDCCDGHAALFSPALIFDRRGK
jgi:hypothetical protein